MNIFRPRNFYIHEAFKDVFIEVLRTSFIGPKYTKLKVRWWNSGQMGIPYLIDEQPQTITIVSEDMFKWRKKII